MGKFKKILQVLLGEDQEQAKPQNQEQVDAPYAQDKGTLVTLNAEQVQVAVLGDNQGVEVQRRPPMQRNEMRMGGEEIKAGTLH